MKTRLFTRLLPLLTAMLCNITMLAQDAGNNMYNYRLDAETHTAVVTYGDDYNLLTDVVIPATIEVDGETYTVVGVDRGAFNYCNLRSVSIYANLTQGTDGFSNCSPGVLYVAENVTTMLGLGFNPQTIYCFGNTPPVCDENTFSGYNAALHVSEQAMIDYFTANVWCNFNNIHSDVGEQPKSLTLSQDSAAIGLSETLQLTATVLPSAVIPIYWQSTNTEVATVTNTGMVTAIAAGETDIIVTCMRLRKQCHVTVQDEAIVATIDQHELTLDRGNYATLTATTAPIEANVTWRSTDTGVATVTVNNGRATIHAVAAGEALIIATPGGDNVVPDTCHVTVNEIMVFVSINQHELKMKRNDIVYLTANTSPFEATVTWSSTDTNVALMRVVNGRAMVVANRPGEALIIATPAGELVQPDTCHVTVKRPKSDSNNDGLVDIADVNEVINIMLGKTVDYEINDFTDLNGDGIIDIADVNAVINAMLGKIDGIETITVNGVSFKMIYVEGGTFTMGVDEGYWMETPAHQVTLSDYAIGETEVTQELWLAVMGSNPSNNQGNLQCPVENVSWDDCQTFISRLNQLTGMTFRLPTDAEWEFAAYGSNKSNGTVYAGSEDIELVGWYGLNSNSQTHPVASKKPNELGLYDMTGNVWEWCQDWYADYTIEAQTNPTGPDYGSNRIFRGGSFYNDERFCRIYYRGFEPSYSKGKKTGLRLAL